uniref:Quinone oxidoreductase n=1 Tax=uncultured bacterium lac111 TaxID=1447235 RepID=X2L802_9BACT|nr:quinone oxidoreductase [uncultured bacterium lac111]
MQVVDVPLGDPGPGEVRVRHSAIGVNFIDTYQRSGLYKQAVPFVLGAEAAGVIDAIGPGVTQLAVGDRVAYSARGPGSYAEARVLDVNPVFKLPDSTDFETAAAMMLKGLTVNYLLQRTRPISGLQAGDMIVWHAAAGGVGLIACQWARALGLIVIATAGSDEKCELAKRHGATHAINYRREDVVARVRELTGGRGVKVVYDSVGKDTWERSIECLAPFGLMVSFGNASGPVAPVNLLSLSKNSLYVTRPTLNTHLADRSVGEQMASELFDVVSTGKVKVEIGARYKLDDAAQAHRDLESRNTTGSLILTL